MKKEQWWVDIVEVVGNNNEVVKRLGPFGSESECDRADRGVNINLNHERFFTRILSTVPVGKERA